MKAYMKPDVFVTEFQVNEAIAACDRVVTGTQTTTKYEQIGVHCIIGNQSETVFNSASGCSTSANQWAIVEDSTGTYFIWYTYAGDTGSGGAPSQSATNKLNSLVSSAGFATGSGWHYADVSNAGEDIIEDILGFSY